MGVGSRADYLLVKRDLENELALLGAEEKEMKPIDKYVTIGSPIYELEKKAEARLAYWKQSGGETTWRG